MAQQLPQSFFERPVLDVAEELLGALLVRTYAGTVSRHILTEVEAYDGEHDLACHASRGRTPRTEVMYGPPGHWYVYLVYGMHNMLNVVTGSEGYPAAVLIRGVEHIDGPGKLTRALKIDRRLNSTVVEKKTGLWFEKGTRVPGTHIVRTPRIGVAYAGEWAKKPWRFVYKK